VYVQNFKWLTLAGAEDEGSKVGTDAFASSQKSVS
jgi:hypothetical protein